jgi:Domain of unknown function (DUF397)
MTGTGHEHGADAWSTATWRRSSACGDAGCLEVASRDGLVALRDSNHPDAAPLVLTEAEWATFIIGAKAGEFDRA